MQNFEIRIIKKNAAPVIYPSCVASVLAAVRRACSLAELGDMIEVWHGLRCLYIGAASAPEFGGQPSRIATSF